MTVYKKIKVGKELFYAELADTLPEWIKGLSGRVSMKKGQGLLFVYTSEKVRSFWMKDMNFPLDILLFDESLKVVGILKDLPVSELLFPPHYTSEVPIRYALEVNKGASVRINIGDELKVIKEIKK